ncbi:MAG: ATP-dependent metallopeptidase FtsH/Yme1/Tma family protein [Epsilonproteobacteria bacterium]|nr:ATP-dependent metallopeptidase FtsH/Yme1/Tma family protein [Campylobacterota bacterium]
MPLLRDKKRLIPLIAFIILVLLSAIAYFNRSPKVIDLQTYSHFLKSDLFQKAVIKDYEVILYTDEDKYSIIKDGINLEDLLVKVPVEVQQNSDYSSEIFVLLLLFIVMMIALLFGRRRQLSAQKNDKEAQEKRAEFDQPQFHRKIEPSKSTVTFANVAGIDEVKEELNEIVDYLKNPSRYLDYGISLPKGVLLVGPPGVGKTMIAKAVAGEADVPFFYHSGASFVQIYVGMGAKRVRELFENAKRYAPAIIFIDEIDAVGKARGGGRNDERESTLNQLLTEMDGFEDNSNIIVIAATNKIEMLDEALLRSGRFDRRVFVSLPNLKERQSIIDVYLKDKPHQVNSEEIAKMSVGFSGAALSTLVNEAALNALKRDAKKVQDSDFSDVKDKVLLGKRKILSYSEEEKRIQATYQAAKALSAYWYEVDFDKVTMINGFIKDVEKEIESKTQMLSKLKVYLSGFVASELFYNETYTNSAADLKRAKMIADEMVQMYAMGEGVIPTAIDSANLIDEAIEDVEQFLVRTKKAIKKLENLLLEKESLSKDELQRVVGEFL